MKCFMVLVCAALGLGLAAVPAAADTYNYVDWTAANAAGGTASGVITLPDASTVDVSFKATYANGAPGSFFFAQTVGGTNYWSPSTPYISAQVENAPPGTDIVALVGGQNQIYTVTLSEAIKDPIMAIVSLGSGIYPTTYEFNSPFEIVSQGAGFWGGNATTLQQLPGNVLRGNEGHGTIRFLGTFSTFSWVVPSPENWHGFTFGIRTTERLDPDVPAVPLPAAVWPALMMMTGIVGVRIVRRVRQG